MAKSRIKALAALGATLSLTACAAQVDPETNAPAEPVPSETADSGEACGADMLQPMLGQPEGEIHEPSLPQPYRIIHPGQAVTMDYNPNRLNIQINEDGRVEEIECG